MDIFLNTTQLHLAQISSKKKIPGNVFFCLQLKKPNFGKQEFCIFFAHRIEGTKLTLSCAQVGEGGICLA